MDATCPGNQPSFQILCPGIVSAQIRVIMSNKCRRRRNPYGPIYRLKELPSEQTETAQTSFLVDNKFDRRYNRLMIKGVFCAKQMVMMLIANEIRRNDEERFCT